MTLPELRKQLIEEEDNNPLLIEENFNNNIQKEFNSFMDMLGRKSERFSLSEIIDYVPDFMENPAIELFSEFFELMKIDSQRAIVTIKDYCMFKNSFANTIQQKNGDLLHAGRFLSMLIYLNFND